VRELLDIDADTERALLDAARWPVLRAIDAALPDRES
jgi:hypothetical protein